MTETKLKQVSMGMKEDLLSPWEVLKSPKEEPPSDVAESQVPKMPWKPTLSFLLMLSLSACLSASLIPKEPLL